MAKVNQKITTNASGFGPHGRKHDLRILPLEAPEIVGIIGIAFVVFMIALAL